MMKFPSPFSSVAAPKTKLQASAMANLRLFRQKNHLIKQLPQSQSSHYGVMIWPESLDIDLAEAKIAPNESVALVGNSGIRTLDLASQLMLKHGLKAPQIYLMDYDYKVITFWRRLKAFFHESILNENFDAQLKKFLQDNQSLHSPFDSPYLAGKADSDFKKIKTLIDQTGFAAIKDLIAQAVLIRQEWADTSSFESLKKLVQRDRFTLTMVYASNILSLTSENKALKIAENIALLKPQWSIHENFSPFIGCPTEAFISSDCTPIQVIAELEKRHSLASQGFCIVGMRVMSPQARIEHEYYAMLSAVKRMIEIEGFGIDYIASGFIPDVILKMSGINEKMRACYFESSFYKPHCVLHLPYPSTQTEAYVNAIQKRFPELEIDGVAIKETERRAGLNMRLSMDIQDFIKKVLPQIPAFLTAQPELLAKYQLGHQWMIEGMGYYAVVKTYGALFAKYQMSCSSSDCMEETLCYLVKQDCEKRGISVPDLMTTQSQFTPYMENDEQTLFLLTTPKNSAKELVNYFNRIEENSARLIEEEGQTRTQLVVNCSVLLNPQFLAAMEETVKSYPKTIRDYYVSKAPQVVEERREEGPRFRC